MVLPIVHTPDTLLGAVMIRAVCTGTVVASVVAIVIASMTSPCFFAEASGSPGRGAPAGGK